MGSMGQAELRLVRDLCSWEQFFLRAEALLTNRNPHRDWAGSGALSNVTLYPNAQDSEDSEGESQEKPW